MDKEPNADLGECPSPSIWENMEAYVGENVNKDYKN